MPNYTSNYKLTKPLQNELYDISIQNGNMDILDTNLKSVSNVANYAKSKSDTNADNLKKLKEFEKQPFESTGDFVTIHNFEGMPLSCVTTVEPIQSGSGDPSPSNIREISGWKNVTLTRCGKNLMKLTSITVNPTTVSGVTFTVNSDGTITVNGTATDNAILILTSSESNPTLRNALLGKQISMSGCPSGGGVNKYVIRLFQHAGENSRIDDAGSGATATFENAGMPYNIAIIVWSGTTVNNLVFRPMIRLASESDASYEPYTDDIYTADFGQMRYGGTLDWNTGLLTVDRHFEVFTGDEYWEKSSNTKVDRFISPVKWALESSDVICSHGNGGGSLDDLNHCYITASSNFAWNYSAYGSTTVEAFKAYLAAQLSEGTPVKIVAKLKTPLTVQLTPNEINALAGVNSIWCDAGETTVSGRTDILWLTSNLLKRVKELESTVAALEAAAVSE